MISPIGAATEEGLKTLPEIIRAAAESPLGIFALMIICVSACRFQLIRRPSHFPVRVFQLNHSDASLGAIESVFNRFSKMWVYVVVKRWPGRPPKGRDTPHR